MRTPDGRQHRGPRALSHRLGLAPSALSKARRRIPLREEELRARKQPVQAGEVEIRKEVLGTARREEARIEREGDLGVRGSGRE